MIRFIALSCLLFVASCGKNELLLPDCNPKPVANAGEDKILISGITGLKVKLGAPAVEGSQYHWMPMEGLDNPYVAEPIATLKQGQSITYTVSVSNKCGLVQDSVNVDVYEEVK